MRDVNQKLVLDLQKLHQLAQPDKKQQQSQPTGLNNSSSSVAKSTAADYVSTETAAFFTSDERGRRRRHLLGTRTRKISLQTSD